MHKPMKSILMLQNTLAAFGGANAVSAWMLEALKFEYRITLLLWTPVEWDAVNRHYGTRLHPSEFNLIVCPAWIRRIVNALPGDPWNFQGYCLLMRWCKIIGHRYDILLSCNDETDFGMRGIQYVHYPYQKRNWEKCASGKAGNRRESVGMTRGMWARVRPWRLISGFSFKRMRENRTLVNSLWTGQLFSRIYAREGEVVYPPVPGVFPHVPWHEKENGFVCIGRITAEKRIEMLIEIIAEIRKNAPEIHLHIIGFPALWDTAVYERIRHKAARHSTWLFMHENISRTELVDLVSRHRYGIHGMKDEHFGIAVAEMLHGGCIPFVPDSGGQVEIVGGDARLLYHRPEQCVEKIKAVLGSASIQTDLLRFLNPKKSLFSTDRFVRQIQEIVRAFSAEADQ